MLASENKEALLRCIELFNQCTLEWVDACYSKKLEWIEFPRPVTPQGRHGDFAFFRNLAEQLLRIIPNRKLRVLRSVAENDCVVLEQAWEGTVASAVGNFTAGQILRTRIISFFTLEDGLIIKQFDYVV